MNSKVLISENCLYWIHAQNYSAGKGGRGDPHQGLNTYRLGLNQKCLMKAGGQGDDRRRMLILENEDKLLQGFKQKKPGIILGLEKV